MITRLSDFILEQNNYISFISLEETLQMISNNDFYVNHDYPIFRKVNQGGTQFHNRYSDFNIVDPTKINRVSPNASFNYVNLLVSNLPSWKDYPKRNNSLICGNYERTWGHFGYSKKELFLVMPHKNSNIGIAESGDFWEQFVFGHYNSLNDLNSYLNRMLHDDSDWNTVKKLLKQIDINVDNFDENIPDFISVEKLDILLNPNKHRLKHLPYNEDFQHEINDDDNTIEYWTDSESLMIRYDKAVELGLV